MSQGDLAHGNNNNAIYSSVHVKEYFKSVPKTFHRSTKQFIVLKLRESEWGEEGKEGEERNVLSSLIMTCQDLPSFTSQDLL